jgi:ADP-ribose pyrophosphatase YjhB (NUDIX family)
LSFLEEQVAEMQRRFGIPDYLTRIQRTSRDDLARIRSTMVNGRAHDITLFITKDDRFIFVAKPFYPPGLYRAPSGGVQRGEDFEIGARREAREETGVDIELERYVLRIDVRFQSDNDHLDWTSHIFKAHYLSGVINPTDKREIREARLVRPEDIPSFSKIMLSSGRGGFAYRAFLTEETLRRL